MAEAAQEEPQQQRLTIPDQLLFDAHTGEQMQYPSQVYYQKISPNTHSESTTLWHVEVPGNGYVLDAFAYVQFTLRLSRDDQIDEESDFGSCFGKLAFGNGSDAALRPALRQNFPIARSIRNVSLTINNYTLNQRPHTYQDALNRLFMSHPESETYASMSAGYYDTGNNSHFCESNQCLSGFSGDVGDFINMGPSPFAEFVTESGITDYVDSRAFRNEGFGSRSDRLLHAGLEQFVHPGLTTAAALGAAHANRAAIPWGKIGDGGKVIDVTLCEPIPIGPFSFYPSMDIDKSIPNITRLELQYDYVSNFAQSVMESAAVDIDWGANAKFTVKFQLEPMLHLRWFRPRFQIPPQVSLKYMYIQTYQDTKKIALPTKASNHIVDGVLMQGINGGMETYNNIRLPMVPDLMLIYFKHKHDIDNFQDPSDGNLAITELSITFDGVSGRILNASSTQLYRMWLSNSPKGTKDTYQEWLKYHCVVALTPTDLGIDELDIVRMHKPVTMNIDDIRWANMSCVRGSGRLGQGENVAVGALPQQADAYQELGQRFSTGDFVLYVQAIWMDKQFTLGADNSAFLRL